LPNSAKNNGREEVISPSLPSYNVTMAPSVCDDPPEASLLAAAATADCSGGANSCDDTFDCGDTASLTLDVSRSFSDEDDDGDHHMLLHEPTDDPLILKIIDGSLEDAATAVKVLEQMFPKKLFTADAGTPRPKFDTA
jgi:hypothetical protein